MAGRTKLKDIAEAVGLSVSTVSLALRGHVRIPPATAERVREVARQLGYIRNRSAADLRTAQSRLVAVCLADLSNPVLNEFLMPIENELFAHGRKVILGVAHEDRALQADFLQTALEHGVSGVVLMPVHGTTAKDIEVLLPGGRARPLVPTVVFSRVLADVPLPQVANDDRMAGQLAAGALIEQGHRRLAFVGGGQETSTARDRLAGCSAALAGAGLAPPLVLPGPTERKFGHDAALAALTGPAPPTGIVCFSDLVAFGVLSACRELGLTPGCEVSVVGCDDMEEAAYCWPALTTVQVDKGRIGRAAARRLLAPWAPVGTQVCQPRLVRRATVGPAPARAETPPAEV